MIWVAWRQHRASILAGLAAIAALAGYLVLTGLGTRADFERLGLDQCGVPTHLQCAEASAQFLRSHSTHQFLVPLFLLLPALVGVFWGAPLVARELEHGTHRLVWMQSTSRLRWLSAKASFLALAVVVASAFVTWLVNWWIAPIMRAEPQQFDPGVFDLLGIVPASYALAALAIGIAAGTCTRKLVPAIGVTLLLFLVLRLGIGLGLRPHFMEPVHGSFPYPLTQGPEGGETTGQIVPIVPAGWKITLETLDRDGRYIGQGVGIEPQGLMAVCPEVAATRGREATEEGTTRRVEPAEENAVQRCAKDFGFHVVAVYQPEDRYWRFQATEAALYLAVSAVLFAGSAWWIRHRIT